MYYAQVKFAIDTYIDKKKVIATPRVPTPTVPTPIITVPISIPPKISTKGDPIVI